MSHGIKSFLNANSRYQLSVGIGQLARSSYEMQALQARHSQKAVGLHRSSACKEKSSTTDNVLFLGTVWPERSSSAAGVRTSDLIESFVERGSRVTVAAGAAAKGNVDGLLAIGVQTVPCSPNRTEDIHNLLSKASPDIVIFDRYYTEEMYSFRVREMMPQALRVLDMQDCHFLREHRKKLAEKSSNLRDILYERPAATSPTCLLRELAAVYRCDLTLVCSPFELEMMREWYDVPETKLALAPFFVHPSPHQDGSSSSIQDWKSREHFCMIGCFNHPPNADSVRWCVKEIWPKIRSQLRNAGAELHIYGSYAPRWAHQLTDHKNGVHMRGFMESLDDLKGYRVLLAPLRYGAGLKGKIVDAWRHGLPVITTPIGAEGMTGDRFHDDDDGDDSRRFEEHLNPSWGGVYKHFIAENMANAASDVYLDFTKWNAFRQRGFELLRELYDAKSRLDDVHRRIKDAKDNVQHCRSRDYVGSMLWEQQCRSTEYFSRWIELKESTKLESAQAQ